MSSSEEEPMTRMRTLPPELKDRICFFAAVQDREFRDRWATGHYGAEAVKELQTAAHGKSLYALALVDRTFHSLCAKHVFKRIVSSQTKVPYFRSHILPRHSTRIHSVDLSGPSPGSRDALSVLSSLPNLKELHLSEKTAQDLLGDLTLLDPSDATLGSQNLGPETPHRYDYHRAMFFAASSIVLKARLNFFHPHKLAPILPCFTALQSLRLQSSGPHQSLPTNLADLLSSHLPNLVELNLYGSTPFSIDPLWASHTWPRLTTLTLRKVSQTSDLFAFLDALSSHLQTLHLTFSTRDPLSPTPLAPPLLTRPFPLLTDLSLTNLHSSSARDLLQSLKPLPPLSPSPILSLELRLRKHERSDNDTVIRSILAFHRTLSHLAVMLQSGRRISTLAKRLCTRPGISFRAGTEADLFQINMTTEQYQTVLTLFKCMAAYDTEGIKPILADDFVHHIRPASVSGFGHPDGFTKEQYFKFGEMMRERIKTVEFGEPIEAVCMPDKVAVWCTTTTTNKEGHVIKGEMMSFYTFAPGTNKIVKSVQMVDSYVAHKMSEKQGKPLPEFHLQ
ncbi:hypothetical protein RQP46_004249 [Phenoliferia psychrophenolica]